VFADPAMQRRVASPRASQARPPCPHLLERTVRYAVRWRQRSGQFRGSGRRARTGLVRCEPVVIWSLSAGGRVSGWSWTRAQIKTDPWPYVLITLFAGAFGLLLYVLKRQRLGSTQTIEARRSSD